MGGIFSPLARLRRNKHRYSVKQVDGFDLRGTNPKVLSAL